MSSRWYPLYQRGNPQLRVFLPNFWLKLVTPPFNQPKNVVTFECSMEMSKYDVRNYLQKIYGVNVIDVRMRIKLGEFHRRPGYIVKEDDIKEAYVVLPASESFTYPDISGNEDTREEKEDEAKQIEELKKTQKEFLKANLDRGKLPGWFGI